jgi:lipoprotein signal peptidase
MLIWLARTDRRLPAIGLALIIGGALGNVTDRMRLGAVRDFLLVHWPDSDWPPDWPLLNLAFNVADAAISCGVVLLISDGLFGPRNAPESP